MTQARATSRQELDPADLRRDFPALSQQVHGQPLVYLDNAATALKPRAVIEAVELTYTRDAGNVHRAVHLLSQRATEAYDGARDKVRRFINAASTQEIVFVRGTTEAINLVAQSYGRPRLKRGDEILVTGLEHHSNIVPWQILREQTGVELVVVPVTDEGEVRLEDFEARLSGRTRLVAIAHASNTLGTVLPIREMALMAHERGAHVLVDGAQAAPHLDVDVRELGADFYALSGHKLYGPTGIGVLYGRRELLDDMPPYQGGGDMIRSVTFERTLYNELPFRFEAGTPHIAGAIGLGAAIDYLDALDRHALEAHEQRLLEYGTRRLQDIAGLRLIGTAAHKIGVLSFVVDGIHPHDLGTIVDHSGVAIRTGHHCTQPLMKRFGVPATARASLALYNTEADLDRLAEAVVKAREMFS